MAWTLYKEIRYDANGIPGENLTNFAKRVSITGDTDIAAECASGGGYKITSADGSTDLAFGDRPQTDLTSGDVHCNFKVTLLTTASVGDVIARLYYSATESTSDDKAGTVSADYLLFMPMEEDPSGSAPQMFDWVSETNLATSAGSMTSGDLVAGQVGNGLEFDGSDDTLTFTQSDFGDTFTCEAIVTPASTSSGKNIWSTDGAASGFNFRGNGTSLQTHTNSGVRASASSVFSVGVTAGVAYVSNGSLGEHALFLNGSSLTLGTNNSGTWTNGTSRRIGSRTAGAEQYRGIIDEVRLSSVARSPLWISCQHEDDFDNASTFTLSAEMGGGGGTFTAEAALSMAAATFAGEATFAPGTKTATAALTTDEATFVGSATFEPPVFEASAPLTTAEALFSATGTAEAPSVLAIATLTTAAAAFAASGTFAPGTKTGSASLVTAAITFDADATFVPLYVPTPVDHILLSLSRCPGISFSAGSRSAILATVGAA